MNIYMYDDRTKEYIGSCEAYLDPVASKRLNSDVYLMPPSSTLTPILEATKGTVNVFNEELKAWELIEDNRGLEVFDKKGNSLIISELGPIPAGYSKTKPFILQEERKELLMQTNLKFAEAQAEDVTIDNFVGNIETRVKLIELLNFIGDNEFGSYDSLPDGTSVILTRSEIEYAAKYLYVRSMLLAIRKNEIMKDIKTAKSKKQLEQINIDFNVLRETKKLASKTDEEISTYIRENLQ